MTPTSAISSTTTIRDVSLRDGLQLTGKVLPTEKKALIVRRLLALGVPEIEIGSMARPDLVPPMANSLELIGELTPEELRRCWVWVATPRHIDKAAQAGARNFQYCFSASDAHNRANIGRDTEASVAALPSAIQMVQELGGRIEMCVATAFSCPYDGDVDPQRILDITADARTQGVDDIVLCDTLGRAVPGEVAHLVTAVHHAHPDVRVAFHGHDTWGMGVANAITAINCGARMVDATLGGLGGCPFAPGAAGNTPIEDIAYAIRPPWLRHSTFADLVTLADELLADVAETSGSKAARSSKSSTTRSDWTT
ncbi:hydroxymethylglutaryl-CoA lyase [Gordonia sp. L191]|uniref:hydroxymethylglutaryl-CoA lyase n=1 Tax=Gordonia sp. L191 TaxID=2982699 RepID=UPI0024BF8FBD|nr:hydroxymethylglutaryl-CoA lyase [Gordonia sp. L191]WHU46524.1 hydroxymethylglutaryl-CoA lyase [Gordonia sp. L191]